MKTSSRKGEGSWQPRCEISTFRSDARGVFLTPFQGLDGFVGRLTQGFARRLALPWAIIFRAFSPYHRSLAVEHVIDQRLQRPAFAGSHRSIARPYGPKVSEC